jgi:hypothetical protein
LTANCGGLSHQEKESPVLYILVLHFASLDVHCCKNSYRSGQIRQFVPQFRACLHVYRAWSIIFCCKHDIPVLVPHRKLKEKCFFVNLVNAHTKIVFILEEVLFRLKNHAK